MALLRWGEPRFTRGIDVSLLCGFGREDEFIAPFFAAGYQGRISDAAAFARRNRVLLLPFRPRDLADVESVGTRQGSELDWAYIERQLAPSAELKESSGIMQAFTRLRQELG